MSFATWTVVWGEWDLGDANAVFHGSGPGAGLGLILAPVRMSDGEVRLITRASACEAQIQPAAGPGTEEIYPQTRLLFGYDAGSEGGYLAGVGGYGGRYIVQRFGLALGLANANASGDAWQVVAAAGEPKPQPFDQDFQLAVRTGGTRASLSINNTTVIDAGLPMSMAGDQIGVFVSGQNVAIQISSFQTAITDPQLFVVMPFESPHDELYREVIVPVGQKLGFSVQRADEQSGPGPILTDIIQGIRSATVVVADISNGNPNVYYEVGYAHAAGTPTILLANRGEKLPFDISGFRCIFYDNTIGGKPRVEDQLHKHLEAITSAARSPLLP